jgi:DNA-binding MarR family transcriptional regulator
VNNIKKEKQDSFAPALSAASRAMTATMMAKVASCGFSDMTPALASLMPLLDATGARATTLAQRAGITKQAISQLVRELEGRGYVEQAPDSTDTRAKNSASLRHFREDCFCETTVSPSALATCLFTTESISRRASLQPGRQPWISDR